MDEIFITLVSAVQSMNKNMTTTVSIHSKIRTGFFIKVMLLNDPKLKPAASGCKPEFHQPSVASSVGSSAVLGLTG
jgi:hypothetical protein